MAKSVQDYIEHHSKWTDKLNTLHQLFLNEGFKDSIKWSRPVYIYNNTNVLGLGAFKNHMDIWFFQGNLIDDDDHILEKAQDQTQGMRHIKFTEKDTLNSDQIKHYINMAKAASSQKAGIKKKSPKSMPDSPVLAKALNQDKKLKMAFEALTLSQRRAYTEHIAEAKREATKQRRLEKMTPMILAGKGLNDKYRK